MGQCGDKQARLLVAIASRHQGERAFAVIDLHLLAGEKGQAVKLLGLFLAQLGGKAFDAVVGAGVTVRVDQVLVDGGGVAAMAQLGLNELPVTLHKLVETDLGAGGQGGGI